MALLDLIHQGSFRGVKFYVQTATTTGGRKQVKHEYPYSDKQAIEDLGFQPRNFRIDAIIAGNPTDGSYFTNRDALLTVLEQKGNGTLSHPFFASSFEVTAKNWTLNESFRNLGYSTIALEFDINNKSTNPTAVTSSLSFIDSIKEKVIGALKGSFESTFNAISPVSFDEAKGLVKDFSDTVNAVTSTYAQIQSEIAPFQQLINDLNTGINQLIQVPQNLSDSVFSIITSAENLYDNSQTAFAVYRGMFDFGDTITRFDQTTVIRTQMNVNTNQLSNSAQGGFTALAYVSACESEYQTVDEIETVQEILETQYVKLMQNIKEPAITNLISELRTQSVKFLEVKKLNASQILPINVAVQPLSVIAYQYYAEDSTKVFFENFNTLVQLNPPKSNDLTFIGGEIKVLTA